MADVVDVHRWNEVVADMKEVADKWQSAFDWKRFPNGKERVFVEVWYNPKESKDGKQSTGVRSA